MKKTIIGIMIMAVAIMMTLSSVVFAAGAVAGVDATTTVGEKVTVTINHPAGTFGGQYYVTYNTDLLKYVGDDTETTPGKVKVVAIDLDTATLTAKEVPTHTLTFEALKAGTAELAISDVTLSDEAGNAMADVTVTGAKVTVNEKAKEEDKKEDKKEDKEINKLKDAKTGFDAMYVVYLAAAVVVAAGIVTVARRK